MLDMLTAEPLTMQASAKDSAPSLRAMVHRRLDMNAEEADQASELPTVYDLMHEVTRLQQAVRDIGDDDLEILDNKCVALESFSVERTPPQCHQKIRTFSGSGSGSFSKQSIYSGQKVATNVSNMSPCNKHVSVMAQKDCDNSVAVPTTPLTNRREGPLVSRTVPRPTHVAALTRENISLLPMPRVQSFTGSVCGSQKSRTSIRTDGGAVFSRLYQPDFYKTREEKSKTLRDRRDSFNCSFTPRTNRRDSISSRDSIGSQTSMQSARTDVVSVSSRLYDPEYVRKRNARLQRMREEREMRECTFKPTINGTAHATLRKTR